MKGALQRVEDIAAFQLGRLRLEQIPLNRLSALARYGLGTKAPKLERTPEPKRTAMLTAVMRHLEAKAIDDALDLFEILMATRLISSAKRSTDKQRLSTLPQLEKAARITARVSKVVIEELELIEQTGCDVDVAALWRALEEVAPRAALSSAAATVVSLVPEDDDSAETALRGALALRYNTVKPFLPLLGESKALDAAPGGRRILTGVQRLPALSRRKVGEKPLLPREVDDKLVAGALAQGGVRERRAAPGGGGPGRVRGVRAGTALPRPEAPRYLRLPLAPLVRPARPAASGQGVGGGARGCPCGSEPGRGRRTAPSGTGRCTGRDLEADGRAPSRGRDRREDQHRGPAERAREAERGEAPRAR